MPLNEGDKAIIKDIAFEAVTVIKEELVSSFRDQIVMHELTCPGNRAINRLPRNIIFLAIGIGLGSGAGVAAVVKLLALI